MGWDDQFNLIEDGDPYERLWWPLLKDHFSEWERFWKHHVVPLTNRIDEKIKPFDAKKRFLRRDDKINTDIEMMAMRSYSVFYYLARASTIILFEPHLFIEDAFFYLAAATENAEDFVAKVRGPLTKELQLDLDALPNWENINGACPIREIKGYRNVLSHWPKLGRHPTLGVEFIPIYERLHEVMPSWSAVQRLPFKDFQDGRFYLRTVRVDLMKLLNPIWKQVTDELDKRRTNKKYLELYRLGSDGKPLPASKLKGEPPI